MLILLFVLVIYKTAAFPVTCPQPSERYLRSIGTCIDYHSYTCLFDENLNSFSESCSVKIDFQRPGYRVTLRTNLHAGACPDNLYQPFIFFANQSSNCELKWSVCSDEGQIVSSNGTTSTDRHCRCNYAQGYTYVTQPKNVCFCIPSEEDCSCYRKLCSKNHILSPDYQCINQLTWYGRFLCSPMSYSGAPEVTILSNEIHRKEVNTVDVLKTERTTGHVPLQITIVTVILLLTLTIYFVMKKYDATGLQEQPGYNHAVNKTVDENELILGPATHETQSIISLKNIKDNLQRETRDKLDIEKNKEYNNQLYAIEQQSSEEYVSKKAYEEFHGKTIINDDCKDDFSINNIIDLKHSSDPCFIALGLLVIYNNRIDKQSFILYGDRQTTELRITDVLSDMLQETRYNGFMSLKVISSSLSSLKNKGVKETDSSFTCINKSMFDMLVGTAGRHFIHCILKYSESEFIKNYIEVEPFTTDWNAHTIRIESKYEKKYLIRIKDDINNGLNWEVFGSVQMENENYRLSFIKMLNTNQPIFCKSKKDGSTPLHITSLLGYTDLSKCFLENGWSQVNSRDNTGKTPLHMACSKGNIAVAKLLVKYKAEVNQMDVNKVTPFMLACSYRNIEVIKFLHTKQVNINALNSFRSNPLLDACINNSVGVVSVLLHKKAKVDCFNKHGDTPLHLACQSGQTEIVNLLIQCDLNSCINKPNVKGYTPFYLALSKGHDEISKILLNNGADQNHPNKSGDTPLHLACQSGLTTIVNLLIKYNVAICINKPNSLGNTPFELALENGHTEIAKILSHLEVTQIYQTKMD